MSNITFLKVSSKFLAGQGRASHEGKAGMWYQLASNNMEKYFIKDGSTGRATIDFHRQK